MFESGLKLGHESLYILNRKKQKVLWLGSSLPRPSIVAVPLEVYFITVLQLSLVFISPSSAFCLQVAPISRLTVFAARFG
jgi:hypothetical protein